MASRNPPAVASIPGFPIVCRACIKTSTRRLSALTAVTDIHFRFEKFPRYHSCELHYYPLCMSQATHLFKSSGGEHAPSLLKLLSCANKGLLRSFARTDVPGIKHRLAAALRQKCQHNFSDVGRLSQSTPHRALLLDGFKIILCDKNKASTGRQHQLTRFLSLLVDSS